MSSSGFDITSRFADGLPDPAPRFGGFPKYNFIGGHNDPVQIPIEGLIEATASVLRREGSKLAMYNLAQGPQGYVGLREFVADKLKRQGITINQVDQTPFRALLRPYYEEWANTFGPTEWGLLQTSLGRKLT